jgi:hypothetical protein
LKLSHLALQLFSSWTASACIARIKRRSRSQVIRSAPTLAPEYVEFTFTVDWSPSQSSELCCARYHTYSTYKDRTADGCQVIMEDRSHIITEYTNKL